MPGPDRALGREVAVIELNWNHPEISEAIRLAVAEDVGSGDVTTEACVPAADRARGVFLAREPMRVAGSELLREIFAGEELELLASSGDRVERGAVIARVSGLTRNLLTMERTALNFLQRLSGIATAGSRLVGEVEGAGLGEFSVQHVPEEKLRADFEKAEDPLQKTFAGLQLQYAAGDPIDMGPALELLPLDLASVRDYVTKLQSN